MVRHAGLPPYGAYRHIHDAMEQHHGTEQEPHAEFQVQFSERVLFAQIQQQCQDEYVKHAPLVDIVHGHVEPSLPVLTNW